MATANLEDLSTQLRQRTNRVLVQRLSVAVWVIVAVVALFALGDLWISRQRIPILYSVKLIQIGILFAAYRALRSPAISKRPVPLGLFVLTVSCLAAATSGILTHDPTTTPILLLVLMMATAVVLPWGPWPQLAVVVVAALSILWNVVTVTGGLEVLIGYHGVAVVVAFGASLYVAAEHRASVELRDLVRRREFSEKLIESSVQGIVAFDQHCRLTVWNPAMERLSGLRSAETLGQCVFDLLPFLKEIGEDQFIFETLGGKAVVSTDRPYAIPATGRRGYFESHYAPLVNEFGKGIGGLAIIRDVTERKRAEHELRRVNRALKALSEGNAALVRATEESQLLQDICRVVVEAGGYRFAWVGYAEQDDAKTVRPVAWAGYEAGYLTAVNISWADTQSGRGPIGSAIRTGEPCVVKDILTDGAFLPWCREASARGYASVIGLPLTDDGRPFGALGIYAAEPDAFDTEEVRLLRELAGDLAYGIGALRTRAQRLWAEELRQEEAQISAALVRVGQEMISSLDTAVLLDRLCQVATEVLRCDCSHTFLRQPDRDVFVPVSSFGDPPETWESLRVLEIPRAVMANLLARLEREEVAQVVMQEAQASIAVPQVQGITVGLYMALRRGREIVGVQTAAYRNGGASFTPQQERIARGIAQTASLALAHAQLVEQLERANRLKSDFVDTMSHELRTPLNAIIGYNDLLLEEDGDSLTAEQVEILRQVRQSSLDLLELISATLDLSRLEKGEDPVEEQEVHLADLLSQLEAEAGPLGAKPGVRFSWMLEPWELQVRTDPVKLRVVLKNLIANAIKFTERGSVTVEARRRDGGVEITVSDTGIGIAAEHRAIIFEPFRQTEPYLTRRYGGTGLGLYIVRRILDVLGGTVAVESEVGRGSTFRVWLPATTRPTDAELQAYIVGPLECPDEGQTKATASPATMQVHHVQKDREGAQQQRSAQVRRFE